MRSISRKANALKERGVPKDDSHKPGIAKIQSFPFVYTETGGDLAIDDCIVAGGYSGLSFTACIGTTPGGLSDHSGRHFLSRRKP